MHISKNSATQIVEEISKLVKQNINLMDETGHIIASCDKSRIGDFHYGAYKIISENLEEYYIDEDDTGDQIIERVVDSGAYDDTELRNLVKQLSEAKKQYKLLTKIAENTERQSHHAELLLK